MDQDRMVEVEGVRILGLWGREESMEGVLAALELRAWILEGALKPKS